MNCGQTVESGSVRPSHVVLESLKVGVLGNFFIAVSTDRDETAINDMDEDVENKQYDS